MATLSADSFNRTTTEPELLRRPLPPANPFPVDCLGNILAPAAKTLRRIVQAPTALCAQSLLAGASLAAQAHADIEIDGRSELLSLWFTTVAESGERKSATDHWALHAHKEIEHERSRNYDLEAGQYDRELKLYDRAERNVLYSNSKKPAACHDALKELGDAPLQPLSPQLLITDPTLEGLYRMFSDGQPSVGLFNNDAADFLCGHAMNRDNRAKSAAAFSRLWDQGEFSRVRAAAAPSKHYGKRLSLHLLMQPVIAESILSDRLLTGQGFLARSLTSWPDSLIGNRPYVDEDITRDASMQRYWDNMRALLDRPPILRPDTRNELQPRHLILSPEAKAMWIAIHDDIEEEMDKERGGKYMAIQPWASKAGSQILRMAGILTLVSDPDASAIQSDAIFSAARLMTHYLNEALRIIGTQTIPPDLANAERLLHWCQESGISTLHSGMALQFGPNCIRTKDDFDKAITKLVTAGWAGVIPGGTVGEDGRHHRRAWTIKSQTE